MDGESWMIMHVACRNEGLGSPTGSQRRQQSAHAPSHAPVQPALPVPPTLPALPRPPRDTPWGHSHGGGWAGGDAERRPSIEAPLPAPEV